MGVNFDVKVSGPIFEQTAQSEPRKAAVNVVKRLVEAGQSRLAQLLRKRPEGVYLEDGTSVGNYRRNVKPEFIVGGLSALITDGGVVYGPWLEGVGSRNETTRFKGYATFRKTAEWLDTQVDGFAQIEAEALVRNLGG